MGNRGGGYTLLNCSLNVSDTASDKLVPLCRLLSFSSPHHRTVVSTLRRCVGRCNLGMRRHGVIVISTVTVRVASKTIGSFLCTSSVGNVHHGFCHLRRGVCSRIGKMAGNGVCFCCTLKRLANGTIIRVGFYNGNSTSNS